MSEKTTKKPLSIALGAAFVTTLATAPIANAAENPFAMSELSGGYMMAENNMEGKCGEGKCGGDKAKSEAEAGSDAAKSEAEGKCGEGKCGGDKAKSEAEGKCGEGKCGGDKK